MEQLATDNAITAPAPPQLNHIYCADALEQLARFAAASVDTIVTSPPYYRQRDYRGPGQLGQEPTPDQYTQRLVAVFRQVRCVLRDRGTLWLVLGDKYDRQRLLGMPWRVALALQEDGWLLRSDIIWHKPNAMPSAVKNRPTTDHEYVFLLSKSDDYYYDIDAIREPHVTFSPHSRMRGGRNHFFKRDSTPEAGKNGGHPNLHDGRWDQAFHPRGATNAPSGRFRCPSSAKPISPSSPPPWWKTASVPAVRRAASSSTRSWAAAPRRWSPAAWTATTSASITSSNTAKWPSAAWHARSP